MKKRKKRRKLFAIIVALLATVLIVASFCAANTRTLNDSEDINDSLSIVADKSRDSILPDESTNDPDSEDGLQEETPDTPSLPVNSETIANPEEKQEEKIQIPEVDNSIVANIEEIYIDIPNVDCHYEFAYLNDAHIITSNMDDVSADSLPEVQSRREMFAHDGFYSDQTYLSLCGQLDAIGANGVIFNGDIVDYTSNSNLEVLKAGLSFIKGNVLYLREDHDYDVKYSDSLTIDDSRRMHETVLPNSDVTVWNYPEFKIIAVNNTTSQISENTMSMIEDIYNADTKPIIFVTHVPINSVVDGSFGANISNDWEGRNISWGYGCFYEPNEFTARWLDMIYRDDSKVLAVLSGHVHKSYDYMITDRVRGHIFGTGFKGIVGKIVVL